MSASFQNRSKLESEILQVQKMGERTAGGWFKKRAPEPQAENRQRREQGWPGKPPVQYSSCVFWTVTVPLLDSADRASMCASPGRKGPRQWMGPDDGGKPDNRIHVVDVCRQPQREREREKASCRGVERCRVDEEGDWGPRDNRQSGSARVCKAWRGPAVKSRTVRGRSPRLSCALLSSPVDQGG